MDCAREGWGCPMGSRPDGLGGDPDCCEKRAVGCRNGRFECKPGACS